MKKGGLNTFIEEEQMIWNLKGLDHSPYFLKENETEKIAAEKEHNQNKSTTSDATIDSTVSRLIYPGQNSQLYALSTGNQDRERLMILNELYNPSSLRLLEITPGLHVLTIGCGIGILELEMARQLTDNGSVLATDISAEQLMIAEKNRTTTHLHQIQFLQLDAIDVEKIPGLFDRIHCRFVLTHLPIGIGFQILELLYKKIAPGGFLLLEEIASIHSLHCEPFHPGYEKWKIGVQKQFFLQNSDPSPGIKFLNYLQNRGYLPTFTSYQPILSTAREKSILSLGMQSASKRFLEEKVMEAIEIEETLSLLHQLEKDPSCFPRYNEIIQIKVQKYSTKMAENSSRL